MIDIDKSSIEFFVRKYLNNKNKENTKGTIATRIIVAYDQSAISEIAMLFLASRKKLDEELDFESPAENKSPTNLFK